MNSDTDAVRTIAIVFTSVMMLMISGMVRGMIYVADAPRRRRVARKAAVGGDQR